MSEPTVVAEIPAYTKTKEWQVLVERQEKLEADGKIALLELAPLHRNAGGGLTVIGKIRDKYKNLVADTSLFEDRMGIGPVGASFNFADKAHLRWIYMVLHCPIVQARIVPKGAAFKKSQHQFSYIDEEASSEDYADKRAEDINYQNKFYTAYREETINFLCIIAGVDNTKSLSNKRADLCRVWEAGRKDGANSPSEISRLKLKQMMDSPDIDMYEAAYAALAQGEASIQLGFYKTTNGVYYYNEEILGNSIEQVVVYFKTHEDVYLAYKKAKTPEGKVAKPIT